MKRLDPTDTVFAAAGYTKGGGIWGDAQWLQPSPTMVIAVGGGFTPQSNLDNDDFLQAPEDMNLPTLVRVYRAPWSVPNWDLTEFEGPTDSPTEHLFSTAYNAMAFVAGLGTGQ